MTPRQSAGARLTTDHALGSFGWLSDESPEFRARLLSIARWRSYSSDEDLYSVGDEPNGLFGLEKGRLDIAIPISDDEMVTIHRAQPGFWVGDSALLAEGPRGISVTTHGECLLLTIPAPPLRSLLDAYPGDHAAFSRLTHLNAMLALKTLAETIALSPKARFARLLLRLVDKDGMVHATQSELGALAGMSRAAFRRVFSKLIDRGVVKTEYGAIRVLDMATLRKVASSA